MISETITIPKKISESEDRFVIKLKDNLLRMIKEINKNGKKIDEIKIENEETDYTDEFNKKVNVDASNIGYGDLFIEKKDEYGEVTYSADDNRNDWGNALTNKNNNIAEDNVTLVSSQNVYNETHPYMDKDKQGNWINPYHYINYKNLLTHEDLENINKQDRWGQKDFLQPHEPNDNMVKENLIALDTAIYQVSQELDEKANISLNNINHKGLSLINGIAMESVYVRDKRQLGVQNPLVKVDYQRVQDQQTGLYTDIYTVYSDYDPSQHSGISLARLYQETRAYLNSYGYEYGKDSDGKPSYVDSGDTSVGYNPNVTVAKNVGNLNDGLVSIISYVDTLRNQLFGNSTGYLLGSSDSDTDWSLQWKHNSVQDASFTFEENQTTHEKDIIIHENPLDQGVAFSSLAYSGKISLIEDLLKECKAKKNEIEKLCQDIYGPNTITPPSSRYQNLAYSPRWFVEGDSIDILNPSDPNYDKIVATDLYDDVYNINDLIYNKTYGILYKIDDLLTTVNAIVDAINDDIIPAINALDDRVTALEQNTTSAVTQPTISNFSNTDTSEYNQPTPSSP